MHFGVTGTVGPVFILFDFGGVFGSFLSVLMRFVTTLLLFSASVELRLAQTLKKKHLKKIIANRSISKYF